jgi:hypothetical protein
MDQLKNKYNVNYIRVEGIDGRNMNLNEDAQNILSPRYELLNTKMKCIESQDEWIYDGTIDKSFPGLHLREHHGTKGLTLSNMKCFECIKSKHPGYNWYCILEDDAVMNEDTYLKIKDVLKNNDTDDVIALDKRGKKGACAILYSRRIIDNVMKDLHPLSRFSINNETENNRGRTNLWDWKLWEYLDKYNVKYSVHKVVESGMFKSEIDFGKFNR